MEWKIDSAPVVYETAIAFMEERVALIRAGTAPECVWLLEHPPLFTAGTGANAGDLLDTLGFPVIATGRGGQYTYHGPGQRVAYVMLDLKRRGADVRAYVQRLEAWIIQALAGCGIKGVIREGRVGVWVETPLGEAKIAAIGVRVRQWVTYHGIAINIAPDLSHYRGIVPCGIKEHGVTSLEAMGIKMTMVEFDGLLRQAFDTLFGM